MSTEENPTNWVPRSKGRELKFIEMACVSVESDSNSWDATSTLGPININTMSSKGGDDPMTVGIQVADPVRDTDSPNNVPSFGSNPGNEAKEISPTSSPIPKEKPSSIVAAEAVTGAVARPNTAKIGNVNARIFPSTVADENRNGTWEYLRRYCEVIQPLSRAPETGEAALTIVQRGLNYKLLEAIAASFTSAGMA
jgi:hypothetical protein